MPGGCDTYELFVRLCGQEVEVLSPQHSVGKQVGKGHGWEGGSFLWPLQSQGDHSDEERRKPRPCSKVERSGVNCPSVRVAPAYYFLATSACANPKECLVCVHAQS